MPVQTEDGGDSALGRPIPSRHLLRDAIEYAMGQGLFGKKRDVLNGAVSEKQCRLVVV